MKDLPRSGRPRVTTRQQDRFIINHAITNRTITGNYYLKLKKKFNFFQFGWPKCQNVIDNRHDRGGYIRH